MQPIVDSLAEATGESAAFAEWGGDGIVFRAKRERSGSYHYMDVGRRNRNVLDHPFALTCLAHCEPAAWRRFATAARRLGLDLEKVLTAIRNEGVHVGRDKALRVVAPVRAHDGAFLGAIGVARVGATDSEPRQLERFRKAVLEHARRAADLIQNQT